MGKNKKPKEQTTNREGESQKLDNKKNVPLGLNKEGSKKSRSS